MQISAFFLTEGAELASLIVSVSLGWFFFSIIHRNSERRALERKLVGLSKTVEIPAEDFVDDHCGEDAVSNDESADSISDNEIESHDTPRVLVDLFESYGLFGAAPGMWMSDMCVADGLSLDAVTSECSEELEPTGGDMAPAEACDLFESYGLFSAAPGVWKTSNRGASNIEAMAHLEIADVPVAPSSALELFESYSLFEAMPGTGNPSDLDGPSDADSDIELAAGDTMGTSQPPQSLPVATLLEHYGPFGAERGTWCNACVTTPYDGASCASTAVFEDEGSCDVDMLEASDDDPGTASTFDGKHLSYPLLFEQYGLFGAPAGTWAAGQ